MSMKEYDITGIKFTKNAYLEPIGESTPLRYDHYKSGDIYAYPYLAFDYHDMLFVLKYKGNIDHRVLSSRTSDIAKIGKSVIAEQVVTLFQEKDKSRDNKTWSVSTPPEKSLHLSGQPFLSVIFLVVRPEVYQLYKGDKQNFGTELITKIEEHLKRKIADFGDDATYQVKHSLHSGDFVILINSRLPDISFRISKYFESSLTATALKIDITTDEKINIFATYTILTQECRYVKSDSAPGFLRCKSDIVKDIQTAQVALRFTATPSALNDLKELGVGSEHKLSLGRYDVSVSLDFTQYNCLYPYLCAFRLDKKSLSTLADILDKDGENYKTEYKCTGDCTRCVVSYIKEEVTKDNNSKISAINTRLFIDSSVHGKNLNTDEEAELFGDRIHRRKTRTLEVQKKTDSILHEIDAIRETGLLLFPNGVFQLEESLQSLSALVRIYSYMGIQTDMYINWKILCSYIGSILDALSLSMKQLTKQHPGTDPAQNYKEKCELTKIIIKQLRRAIDSIEIFSKLSQTINIHTFIEVNYNIQAQASAQKAAVAMSEFLHGISAAQRDYLEKVRLADVDRTLLPIVIPHMDTSNIETFRLFPHGFIDREDIDKNNPPSHLTAVQVSTIEYLYRIADALPVASHELAHCNPILDYKTRNEHLLKEIIKLISKKLAEKLIFNANPKTAISPQEDSFKSISRTFYETILAEFDVNDYGHYYIDNFYTFVKNELCALFAHEEDAVSVLQSRDSCIKRFFDYCKLYHPSAQELSDLHGFTEKLNNADEVAAFAYADKIHALVKEALELNREHVGYGDYSAAIVDIDSALDAYKKFFRSSSDGGTDKIINTICEKLEKTAADELKNKPDYEGVPRSLSGHESGFYNNILGLLKRTKGIEANTRSKLLWEVLSAHEISDICDFVKAIYSEFDADVMMCRIFNFDFAAYLQSLAKHFVRDITSIDNSSVRRIALILHLTGALELSDLSKGKTKMTGQFIDELNKWCDTYVDIIIKEFDKSVTKDDSSEFLEAVEVLGVCMLSDFKSRIDNASELKPACAGSIKAVFNEYISGTELDSLNASNELRRKALHVADSMFHRINTILKIVESIMSDNHVWTTEELEYAKKMYEESGKVAERWNDRLSKTQKKHVTEIREYCEFSGAIGSSQLVASAIEFIMEHYYLNRFRLMRDTQN